VEHVLYAVNSVVPSFLIITLGIFLKRMGAINEAFITTTSKFVFLVCIPALVFDAIAKSNFNSLFNGVEVLVLIGSVIFVYVLSWLLSLWLIKDAKVRGSFIQGAFRSNFSIIGLAIMGLAFKESGLRHGSILLAFILPVSNILSIVVLSFFGSEGRKNSPGKVVLEIVRNPLIISVFAALPFSIWGFSLPTIVNDSIVSLANIALPLSLVGIGGTLRFHRAGKSLSPALLATFIKIIISPTVIVLVALAAGLRGESLGVLFILVACPTAVASFSMADAMGCDRELAAEIIVFTTIAAVVTLSAGLAVLAASGFITPA
jgi:hypothetical protein